MPAILGIIRLIVMAIFAAVLFMLAAKAFGLFRDPNACPRCKGKGGWRGTRAGEWEKCDMCNGNGKKK